MGVVSRNSSPLRYPGGKSCMLEFVSRIISENKLLRCHYIEPYAGGCGLALSLLYEGMVSDIHINDIDPAVWSFWYSVLNETSRFVDAVCSADVTIGEWERQKEIYEKKMVDDPVALGFSAFFLNRTNRSGVIKGAGVIGGRKQDGKYKLDCRFNKENLIKRIKRVASYKSRINLYNMDAAFFVEEEFPEKSFFCIDPPYVKKGASLYTSFYNQKDHVLIADKVKSIKKSWIVTYDDSALIRSAYSGNPQYSFNIRYSLNKKMMGKELLITSFGLRVPKNFEKSAVKIHSFPEASKID